MLRKTKSKITFLALALTLILSATASAAVPGHGQIYAYITRVEPDRDQRLTISVKHPNGTEGLDWRHGCNNPSPNIQDNFFAHSQFPLTNERTKAFLQIALTSFVEKKQVWVQTSGCTLGGNQGDPVLDTLQIRQP